MRAGVADNKWSVETTTWPAVWWPRLGDERLARLAARGNPRAFATVYERYHQVLYRYCRSILRDDADAQDALQSTFTRALSALKRDQRTAPLRPWLFRIAHNEAISVLRRRRRGEPPLANACASASASASAEDQAGERARMAVLLGDLAGLPERARSALVMRELNGLSHEEIAIALETTPGAAKQAIFEARRGLLECVEGRAMPCAEVCQAISDGDRRILRGRRVRAHLRDCGPCAAFAASIEARQADLRAFVPALPVAASVAVLSRAMPGAVGHAGGGGAAAGGAATGTTGATAAAGATGKAIGVAFTSKGFATASVLATAAVSVGGVAAVVRLAPDSTALFKAPGGHSAHIRSAPQVRSVAHAAAVVHSGSAPVGAGSPASGSSVRVVRSGTIATPAHRNGRSSGWYGHGHGHAVGWHGAKFGSWTGGESMREGHGRGGGWGRGGRGARHGDGAAPGVRHDTLEGYAGGRAQHAALEGHAVGRGHHGVGNGDGVGNSDGAGASDGAGNGVGRGRGHHQDAEAGASPVRGQHGHQK
jgi:RNA polymerase sigma factor (sigma-70 family)